MRAARSLTILLAVLAGFVTMPLRGEDPAFVFVRRHLDSRAADDAGPSPAPRGQHRGELMLRGADGRVRGLVDSDNAASELPLDFADPSVSYDGGRVVFAGYSAAESGWRIYEVGIDGEELRQITTNDRAIDLHRYGAAGALLEGHDDLDPCYLPDGRICFSSTRYPALAPDIRSRTTNLYVVNPDGTDLHRITTERFGADTPQVEPSTGRIVYSRWWRSLALQSPPRSEGSEAVVVPDPPPVPPGGYYNNTPPPPPPPPPTAPPALTSITDREFTGLNSWFLAGINPDGTDMAMFSGFHFDRELTQAWRPSFLPDGRALALFLPESPLIGSPGPKGLRRFRRGPLSPVPLGGPQTFTDEATSEFVYASAEPLSDGRLLVTAARRAREPLQFDVYLQENSNSPPLFLHGFRSRDELDAVPVEPREVPPAIEDRAGRLEEEVPFTIAEAFEKGGSFTFLVENIHFNAPLDVPLPSAPPVGKDLVIEFYMSPQRRSARSPDAPILLKRRIVPPDGRIEEELPAGVPLFEVLRTPDGELAVGRDGQVFHVGGMNFGVAAETARCVGCHTGHSMMAVPDDPTWTNLASSADLVVSSFRETEDAGAYRPENLLDRSTAPVFAEWMAEDAHERSWVELSWSTALEAREIVLYAPRSRAESVVTDHFELVLGRDGRTVASRHVREPIRRQGTRLDLDGEPPFDSLRIAFPSYPYAVALAEVEVIARVAVFADFLRGDADCDRSLDVTDGLSLLQGLFEERGFCCEAAADADDNGTVELSDALVVLNYLFLEGSSLPAPFPACGPARSTLDCDLPACP